MGVLNFFLCAYILYVYKMYSTLEKYSSPTLVSGAVFVAHLQFSVYMIIIVCHFFIFYFLDHKIILLTALSRWNMTTRPPLSPVANKSPVLLYSTHDMISAVKYKKIVNSFNQQNIVLNAKYLTEKILTLSLHHEHYVVPFIFQFFFYQKKFKLYI